MRLFTKHIHFHPSSTVIFFSGANTQRRRKKEERKKERERNWVQSVGLELYCKLFLCIYYSFVSSIPLNSSYLHAFGTTFAIELFIWLYMSLHLLVFYFLLVSSMYERIFCALVSVCSHHMLNLPWSVITGRKARKKRRRRRRRRRREGGEDEEEEEDKKRKVKEKNETRKWSKKRISSTHTRMFLTWVKIYIRVFSSLPLLKF